MKINIGTEINLEDLLQSRLLIQANSGGGKSVLARTIVEACVNQVPFIMMDIEGEYYTLKELYGDVLVIGGQHADIPISLKSAKLLPKEIIANQISVVLDLSDLQMSDRILYAKYFIESLMELGREYWKNYLIFIEEAHKLCGEQDKQASAAAVKDLMSRGRKRGFCGVLITQRISKLHKDAAAECNNKFIGRTYLDIDLKRAYNELGFTTREEMLAIRDLKPGNFFAFGTSIKPHQVHSVTVNMPKTKIPKAGVNMEIKPKAPTAKIKALLEKLSAPAVEVKKEAPKPTITGKTWENEYRAEKEKNDHLNRQILARDRYISSVKSKIVTIESAVKFIADTQLEEIVKVTPNILQVKETAPAEEKTFEPVKHHPAAQIHNTELGKCPLEILKFLASFPDRHFTKSQIGISVLYSPNSGGFNNALSELNSKSLIVKEGTRIKVSGNAHLVLGENFAPQTYSIRNYASKLPKCEREIYEVLLDLPNSEFTKEQLASHTPSSYSAGSGGFNNALSGLNSLDIIKRERGMIKLNPELIEFI